MATWMCPFCNQNATIIDANRSTDFHYFGNSGKYKHQVIGTYVIVCPNSECQEFTLRVTIGEAHHISPQGWIPKQTRETWQLVPPSQAKVFPDYVPKVILNDYNEACLIRDLSPKASATLSRRCLQGIIRDFWKISRPRLIDEIEET